MHRVYSLVRRCPNPPSPRPLSRFSTSTARLRPRTASSPSCAKQRAAQSSLAHSSAGRWRRRGARAPRPRRAAGARDGIARRQGHRRARPARRGVRPGLRDPATARRHDCAAPDATRSSATRFSWRRHRTRPTSSPRRTPRVDGVACTRLESDASGRLTDGSSGANCRGPERRGASEWLADAGLEDAELWAYGDSPGDAELLAAGGPSGPRRRRYGRARRSERRCRTVVSDALMGLAARAGRQINDLVVASRRPRAPRRRATRGRAAPSLGLGSSRRRAVP